MVEIILALIIFSLIGYLIFLNKEHDKEVQKLLDRIMSKDLEEFKEHTVPIKTEKIEAKPPEYIPVSELTDEAWDKMIKEQAGTETTKDKAVKKLKSLARN